MTKVSPLVEISPIFLGTAGWAQKVTKEEAYRILETFYRNGFRWIDTATNYPMDREPKNYGKTISWLSDFYSDFPDLKVFVKAGSATNLGDSTQLINASYFALIFDILGNRLGDSLGGIGIHWDNEIENSDHNALIDFFSELNSRGFVIGMSGIANHELYTASPIATKLPWIIQTNLSPVRSKQTLIELDQLKSSFPKAKIYGYNLLGGITSKGILELGDRLASLDILLSDSDNAMESDTLERVIKRCLDFNLNGFVIGPTNNTQCLEWCTKLSRFDFD